jgi:DNA-binding MarR family transcriptional regulator
MQHLHSLPLAPAKRQTIPPLDNIPHNDYYHRMAGKLQAELRKKKPFEVLEQEVMLNLMKTAHALAHPFTQLFKKSGLTESTYNVLRILRGHGDAGVPCHEIAEQMVSYDPDLTRLLDRLETAKLVKRERSCTDRRVIMARIAPEGLKILSQLDHPILELHRHQLQHMSPTKLRTLIDLLEEARGT